MKKLNLNDILNSSGVSKTCISIYLPKNTNLTNPQERTGSFKKISHEIKLLLSSLPESKVRKITEKLEKDYDLIAQEQAKHGVSWFYSELFYGYMPVSWESDPFIVTADSFHIKPILRDRQINRPFFLLLASAKSVKLFANYSGYLEIVQAEALQLEGSSFSAANQKKISFAAEKLIYQHCNTSSDPLIIAGQKVLISSINDDLAHPFKISPMIFCKPKVITLKELNDRARKISADYYKSLEEKIVKDFQYCNVSKNVISDIEKISIAAISGQIENLVVAQDHHIWGILDKSSGAIELHQSQKNSVDDDLLDDISEIVHRCKGNVWVIPKEKLNGSPIYATLRW